MKNWNGKPYHSLDYMLRETFGEKVYKVTLNGGMSCPNRDGKLGTRGCIFCSEGGSGDFAADAALTLYPNIVGPAGLVGYQVLSPSGIRNIPNSSSEPVSSLICLI